MANSSATQQWTLRMPAGTLQQWNTAFTTNAPGGTTPYPISGSTWEYVVRVSPTDATVPPLIEFGTSGNSQGILVVTASLSVSNVLMQMYPAATASLTPGTYYHTLWMDPGTSNAVSWWSGLLLIDGTPQP